MGFDSRLFCFWHLQAYACKNIFFGAEVEMKKRWIAGSVPVLLILALAFAGCEGPAGPGGAQGPGGAEGPGVSTIFYADILVVGMGSAGTMAALAPVRVWPDVSVIAIEAAPYIQTSVIRSMGGGHGAVITQNPGGGINFGTNGVAFNADGSVSVTFGPFGTGTDAPFETVQQAWPAAWATNPGGDRFTHNLGAFRPFKPQTIREIAAHANWMRTVFMYELGIFPAGNAVTIPAGEQSGLGAAALELHRRFTQAFAGPGANHVNLMLNTRGETLIWSGSPGSSEILGVRAQRISPTTGQGTGEFIRIYADKVILATGNFNRDHELMQYTFGVGPGPHAPDFAATRRVNHPNLWELIEGDWYGSGTSWWNCGRGHRMAVQAGADTYPEPYFNVNGATFRDHLFARQLPSTPSNDLQGVFKQRLHATPARLGFVADSDGFLLVNGIGEILDIPANIGYGQATGPGVLMQNDANFPFHLIISSDTNPALTWNSPVQWSYAGVARTADVMAALTVASRIRGQSEVVRADTLADLAEEMGLAGLDATDFVSNVIAHTPAAGERRFRDAYDGPFFAVRVYPSAMSHFAGVASDWRGRVLTTWDDPDSYVEGLYAVGEISFRGLYHGLYIGGSGLTWSNTRGMIAGMDAALRLMTRFRPEAQGGTVGVPSLQNPGN